ncbi:hypothetical protein VXM60_11365 [Shewanella khirikhana]|uniref:hypothetical protein n=1 Tax=Shewanella khirikhana TaxID=1965282 RepID=UPI0030D14520
MHIQSAQLEFFSARGIKLPGAAGVLSNPAAQNGEDAKTTATTATDSRAQLPRERGESAKFLLQEYQDGQGSVDYDTPGRSREAISEYLLNQHAQRREEIRAMVGVDLYA